MMSHHVLSLSGDDLGLSSFSFTIKQDLNKHSAYNYTTPRYTAVDLVVEALGLHHTLAF